MDGAVLTHALTLLTMDQLSLPTWIRHSRRTQDIFILHYLTLGCGLENIHLNKAGLLLVSTW